MASTDKLDIRRPLTIVGLSGAAGTGKSTCADLLVKHYGFTRMAYADTLKDMLRVLMRDYGFNADQTERWVQGDLKEEPCPALMGSTSRLAQQTLGTEWGRHRINNTLWVNLLMARLDATDAEFVVVDDVRMANEAEALLGYGMGPSAIYSMLPKGTPHRRPGDHSSERGLPRELITADIVHDFTMGSLEDEVLAKIIKPINLKPHGRWTIGTSS